MGGLEEVGNVGELRKVGEVWTEEIEMGKGMGRERMAGLENGVRSW